MSGTEREKGRGNVREKDGQGGEAKEANNETTEKQIDRLRDEKRTKG